MIVESSTSNDMVVREGSNVTLVCKAKGYPEPYVRNFFLYIKSISNTAISFNFFIYCSFFLSLNFNYKLKNDVQYSFVVKIALYCVQIKEFNLVINKLFVC